MLNEAHLQDPVPRVVRRDATESVRSTPNEMHRTLWRLDAQPVVNLRSVALPEEVKDEAIALVATYCATKVPAEHDDKIRIEYKVRGNTITIYECRPPWREDFGPDWTSMRICTIQWDPEPASGPSTRGTETTVASTTRSSIPRASVMPLLRELENDPTCIFWG